MIRKIISYILFFNYWQKIDRDIIPFFIKLKQTGIDKKDILICIIKQQQKLTDINISSDTIEYLSNFDITDVIIYLTLIEILIKNNLHPTHIDNIDKLKKIIKQQTKYFNREYISSYLSKKYNITTYDRSTTLEKIQSYIELYKKISNDIHTDTVNNLYKLN